MRPTVIRLIAGGALGIAFSISLTLPGAVVFPGEQPIRQLAAPEAPTATVLRAAPVLERATKAPAPPRIVVHRVSVPTAGTVPATSVVRQTPPRSKRPRKPVQSAPGPVEEPVTPLAARPAAPVTEPADEPTKAAEPREADEPRKAEKPRKSGRPKKAEKPKKAKKPKDPHSGKNDKSDDAGKKHRDDQGDDRRGHEKGEDGSGRDDDSFHG